MRRAKWLLCFVMIAAIVIGECSVALAQVVSSAASSSSVSTTLYHAGDINNDGVINSKDLTRLMRYFSGYDVEVHHIAMDANGDGAVNAKDLIRLARYLSGSAELAVAVSIPDVGVVPDLTGSFKHWHDIVQESVSFADFSLNDLKNNKSLLFTNGTHFAVGENGLFCDNSNWDTIGFSEELKTDAYDFSATLSVGQNDRTGAYNAAMVGVRLTAASHLFIDSGLWFSFRENTVSAYVKDTLDVVVDDALPFSAENGIEVTISDRGDSLTVTVNGVEIATVTIDSALTLKNKDGNVLATCGLDNISHGDTCGYARVMSHYANTTLSSMSLCAESIREYAPTDSTFAFTGGAAYGFCDKTQYVADLSSAAYNGFCFADAAMLAEMFGMNYAVQNDVLILSYGEVAWTFTAGQTAVTVNGVSYPFPTVIKSGDGFLLSAAHFGKLMGYESETADGMIVVAKREYLTKTTKNAYIELFDLYASVVYNYDDVECVQTGVGRYEATPYEDRLVGIAYSTWHFASRSWETEMWDMPLYGPYASDDEAIIRLHGEMLRDAGVDFVFVDWSNNTAYDPATMREQREDFRMIEEATDQLFDIWATIEGAPKICIFVGPGHDGPQSIASGQHQAKVDQVWRDYVENPNRTDMYFYYEGKPLLICYGATPTLYTNAPSGMWGDTRFTVRWMTGFVGQQGGLYDPRTLESYCYWSWEERVAQTFTVLNGKVEAVTVTAATRVQGTEGESGYIPEEGRNNGATLKKQFQRACDLGAGMVLIVSWNEWVKAEQPSAEISKDMEPSQIHGTFYYDLMREQIRKYKGLVE